MQIHAPPPPPQVLEVQTGSGKIKQITYPRNVACSSKQLSVSD